MALLKSKAFWITVFGTIAVMIFINRFAPAKVRNFINNTPAPAA